MNNSVIIGWDVGGAHLKAAMVDAQGQAMWVMQLPCPLWRGMAELKKAVDTVLSQMATLQIKHVVTMTGELVDIFNSRQDGVTEIVSFMVQRLGSDTQFFATQEDGRYQLLTQNEAIKQYQQVASANWYASAVYLAKKLPQALFVDIGSSTADIVIVKEGRAHVRGFSDAARMQYQELVYTGVVRTPLMALARQVPFKGEWVTLAAEHFATTADVYRLTGDLHEAEDMSDTADGADKSIVSSARRLARMIGHDFEDASLDEWKSLAQALKQVQLEHVKQAVLRAYSRQLLDENAPIIAAGAGDFLVRELAQQLHKPYLELNSVTSSHYKEASAWATVCLPAYAVACLAL